MSCMPDPGAEKVVSTDRCYMEHCAIVSLSSIEDLDPGNLLLRGGIGRVIGASITF